jgi:hypothetical protein
LHSVNVVNRDGTLAETLGEKKRRSKKEGTDPSQMRISHARMLHES